MNKFNTQSHKDACAYSIEVAKQFLTLAAAGIAFVIGLATSNPDIIPFVWLLAIMLLLAASISGGLFFLMFVVGNINRDENYDIYGACFRLLAGIQILTFVLPIVFIGWFALAHAAAGSEKAEQLPSQLKVAFSGKVIQQPVYPQSSVQISFGKSNDLKLVVTPSH